MRGEGGGIRVNQVTHYYTRETCQNTRNNLH